jgi:hypothetical protein
VTAIDCPHGVAPERMPKADATGLAPKKSADHNPSRTRFVCAGGFGFHFCSSLLLLSGATHPEPVRQVKIKPHFFGEVFERRPWA